jgi:hypothetical protein
MWVRELKEATISAEIVSQESLGRDGVDIEALGDADVILLDESHNFRNRNAQRYETIERVNLFTRGDRGYFTAAGIGDVYRYFLNARRTTRGKDGALALFNLLEEVVIRRTRPFIRQAYPEATIAGGESTGISSRRWGISAWRRTPWSPTRRRVFHETSSSRDAKRLWSGSLRPGT